MSPKDARLSRKENRRRKYGLFKEDFARSGLARAVGGRYRCQCRSRCAAVGGLDVLACTMDSHRLQDFMRFGSCVELPPRLSCPHRERLRSRDDGQQASVSPAAPATALAPALDHLPARPQKRPQSSSTQPLTQTLQSSPACARISSTPGSLSSRSTLPSPATPTTPTSNPLHLLHLLHLSATRQRRLDTLVAQLAAEQQAEDEATAALELQRAEAEAARRQRFVALFRAARKDLKRLARADDVKAGWAEFCAVQKVRAREARAVERGVDSGAGEVGRELVAVKVEDGSGRARDSAGLVPLEPKGGGALGGR